MNLRKMTINVIDIAQLKTKKSVSDFSIWKQKERILNDCN